VDHGIGTYARVRRASSRSRLDTQVDGGEVRMGSILAVWLVELMDHAGVLRGIGHPTGLPHG
jgi:hypothetical protein